MAALASRPTAVTVAVRLLAAATAVVRLHGAAGRACPYAEVQAENSATNGRRRIGPSYTQGQMADEGVRPRRR